MKATVAIIGIALGLAAPLFLFGAIILTLAAVDVEAQRLGVGAD